MAKQQFNFNEVQQLIKDGLGTVTEDFTPTYESVSTLLDKIGLSISLQSGIKDHLDMFDDVYLPLGAVVEEYVHNLLTVKEYDRHSTPYGQDEIDTRVYYHTKSSDKKIELPVWEDEMQRAFTNVDTLSAFIARMLQRITDTYNQYKYEAKKAAISKTIYDRYSVNKITQQYNDYSNFAEEAITIDGTNGQIVDETSSKKFILTVQKLVEDMQFTSTRFNPAQVPTQSQKEDLVLLLKKGALPIMNVTTLANAFNKELLGLGIDIQIIDDFGDLGDLFGPHTTDVYAVLMDKRTVKYMVNREKTTVDYNGNALRTLYTKHFGETIVVSNATNFVVFNAYEFFDEVESHI